MRIAHAKIRCWWRSTRIAKASVLPSLAEATRIPSSAAASITESGSVRALSLSCTTVVCIATLLSLCFWGSTARVSGSDHSRFNSSFGVEVYSRSFVYTAVRRTCLCSRRKLIEHNGGDSSKHAREQLRSMRLSVHDDLVEHMPNIDTVCYELRTLLGHRAQESFPFFVDERHIVEIDDTAEFVLAPLPALPDFSQF